VQYTIKTDKTVYDASSQEDGKRILVMHTWPRGIKKAHIDTWFKELGTEMLLIKAWKNKTIHWEEFRKSYLKSLLGKEERLEELAQKAVRGTITLLCSCKEEQHCHRIILKELLETAITGTIP